jgi:hypothetical protein
MSTEQPRQMPNLKWKYTLRVGKRLLPIGYCRDHDGHTTEQEAEECFLQFTKDELGKSNVSDN